MRRSIAIGTAAAILGGLLLGWTSFGAAQVTLNVVTAGDTNMHGLQRNVFAPEFEKRNPRVKINAIGGGPGPAGRRGKRDKREAQKERGGGKWAAGVAIVPNML